MYPVSVDVPGELGATGRRAAVQVDRLIDVVLVADAADHRHVLAVDLRQVWNGYLNEQIKNNLSNYCLPLVKRFALVRCFFVPSIRYSTAFSS